MLNDNKIVPYYEEYLQVDKTHKIYLACYGNKKCTPVIYAHGGPGGQSSDKIATLFDLEYYNVILFDQRGCGKSVPYCSIENNNTFETISDMEKIRKHLNINKWIVSGGSWGTTISLVYAINYPQQTLSLILRGIFLARQEDVDYLYHKGTSDYYPDLHEIFTNKVSNIPGNNILEKYLNVFLDPQVSQETKNEYASVFARWESEICTIDKVDFKPDAQSDFQIALFESYYFVNKSFLPSDNYILDNIDKIKDIPTYIIHGRQDIDTRPIGAYLLAKKLNNCDLNFVDKAGHTILEANLYDAFKQATEKIKNNML
ncbi:prolyl aminopeptidase [Mycoplasma corogypsi]|uniref:prolyl aminopeptidase n=1 Tax=Mycoplasma corogypsi TaxID=2106 RepID=UPI003872AA6D